MFAEFELMINEKAERGESLTAEYLCEIYHKLNVDYYGADLVVDKELDMEWARIPHFYNNYYVYQYATGFSAAIAQDGTLTLITVTADNADIKIFFNPIPPFYIFKMLCRGNGKYVSSAKQSRPRRGCQRSHRLFCACS